MNGDQAVTYEYTSDYAASPGDLLAERLHVEGLTASQFASKCGRSERFVDEVLGGETPINLADARQFESVVGLNADIWMGVERDYRRNKRTVA